MTRLSNQEVIEHLAALVRRESDTTLEILLHLSELEERKLHLALGFNSLFAYCTAKLRYSEGAANRRIKAARCIKQFPKVGTLLKERRVSLSTICIFAPLLCKENKDELLSKVTDQNQAEVEKIAALHRPPAARPRDQARPITVATPRPAPEALCAASITASTSAVSAAPLGVRPLFAQGQQPGPAGAPAAQSADGAGPNVNPTSNPDAVVPVSLSPMTRYTFAATHEFAALLQRMQLLLSGKYPKGATLEEVFSEAMGCYLKAHTPGRVKDAPGKELPAASSGRPGLCSRYIPAAVKTEVYRRDGGACSFVSADGRRCGSQWGLQFDHSVPFGLGGGSTASNVRLLCSAHNRFEAERIYGGEYVASRIAAAGKADRSGVKRIPPQRRYAAELGLAIFFPAG